MKNYSKAGKFFMFLILAPVFIALFGYVVMSLWNWLIPDIVGLRAISWTEAMGLLLLSKLMFGGFHGSKKHKCCCNKNSDSSWKHKWKEKWESSMKEHKEKVNQEETDSSDANSNDKDEKSEN